jgi:N-acetylmuramoyl-L-alanine amidase
MRLTIRQALLATTLIACSSLMLVTMVGVSTAGRSTRPVDIRGKIVVLDPGHNGGNAANLQAMNRLVPDGRGGHKPCNTAGTATDAGYPEHAFTFDVTQQVAALLTAQGIRVVLTRTDDAGIGPCVDVRGRTGEDAEADAVISIHADGAAPEARGFHVAYAWPPLDPIQDGPARALAVELRDSLRGAGLPVSTYLGHGGLLARDDLAGLNLSRRPTVLVECANMRNVEEAGLVSTPAGRARYADAIASGIAAFLGATTDMATGSGGPADPFRGPAGPD